MAFALRADRRYTPVVRAQSPCDHERAPPRSTPARPALPADRRDVAGDHACPASDVCDSVERRLARATDEPRSRSCARVLTVLRAKVSSHEDSADSLTAGWRCP